MCHQIYSSGIGILQMLLFSNITVKKILTHRGGTILRYKSVSIFIRYQTCNVNTYIMEIITKIIFKYDNLCCIMIQFFMQQSLFPDF